MKKTDLQINSLRIIQIIQSNYQKIEHLDTHQTLLHSILPGPGRLQESKQQRIELLELELNVTKKHVHVR